MKLKEDTHVVTFTRAEHDDSAEIAEVEQPSQEDLNVQEQEAKEAEQNEVAESEDNSED